jgi:hypothetical protein
MRVGCLALCLVGGAAAQANYCVKNDDVVANYCPSRACRTDRCEEQRQGRVAILTSSGALCCSFVSAFRDAVKLTSPRHSATPAFASTDRRQPIRGVDCI